MLCLERRLLKLKKKLKFDYINVKFLQFKVELYHVIECVNLFWWSRCIRCHVIIVEKDHFSCVNLLLFICQSARIDWTFKIFKYLSAKFYSPKAGDLSVSQDGFEFLWFYNWFVIRRNEHHLIREAIIFFVLKLHEFCRSFAHFFGKTWRIGITRSIFEIPWFGFDLNT